MPETIAAFLLCELRPGQRIPFTTFCALVSKHSPGLDPAARRRIVDLLWNGRRAA